VKIGDRVAYAEENVALGDIHGTVAEPTAEERNRSFATPNNVMVEWDDGERFWEQPSDLVVMGEVGS
jgi:hypothetical protein